MKPNVDVLVGGPINGVAPCQYKTKILKANLSFKGQVENDPNTKFVIKWDFDLKGQTVTIPENCVLEFDGGSLSNGTIVGKNTGIDAGLVKIFDTDVTFSGIWNIEELYPEWFGAKGDGIADDTISIQTTIDNCFNIRSIVVFSNRVYNISSPISWDYNQRLTLKGYGKHKNSIRAISQMECMITSTASEDGQYSSLDCENLLFDGNRQITSENPYFNKTTRHFNPGNTSLVKNAIYMPYGLIYSTLRGVDFKGFDGFCVYADSSWLLLIDDINIAYCDYGVLAIATNSFKIVNSNFSYIRKIAIIAGSGNPIVQGCSLDVIGECAVALGSGAKGAIVKGNYFEHASCDGITLTIPNSETIINDIHPCVIVTGASVNSFKNTHLMAAAFVCSAAIEDNYIDGTEDVSNKYFVIASGLSNSRIVGTACKSGDERTTLGVLAGQALSKVNNVEITGNRNVDGGLFKKIGILVNTGLPATNGIYNIYTNDTDNNSFLSGNLMEHLFLYAPAEKTVKETTTKYLGFPTFTTSEAGVELRVNSVYYDAQSNPYNSLDISLLSGKIVYTEWYSKDNGSDSWVFHSSYNLGTALAYVPIPQNGLVTMPCVFVAGENKGSSKSEILPIAVDRDLQPYPNIHYLPFRKIRVLDNKYSDSAVIVYEDNDIDNTPNIKAILRTPNVSKDELAFTLTRNGNKYAGISIFEESIPIWWTGSEWVDASGTSINGEN